MLFLALVLVVVKRKPCLPAHDPCNQKTGFDLYVRIFMESLDVIAFRYGVLMRLDKGIEFCRDSVEVEPEADHCKRVFP